MLYLILIFAFLSRIFNLSYPPNFYFDEVYNAFTTLEFVKGNVQAYEWFHTSEVEGTAYGWTHPPLAKLLGSLGVVVFGPISFGWRIVNVGLGVGVVYLVYLLFLSLFPKKKDWAILASFFVSLDGLVLVQSRINMNDIVALFFILLSFLMFVKYQGAGKGRRRLFLLGLVLGLAVATKWTGIFLILVFGLWIGVQNIKKIFTWPVIFFNLVVLPGAVYLLSYSQYFVLGGTWGAFSELHKQMWWYNTNLTATHTYQSDWWTWPISLRPVWYFVEYGVEKVANIYAMGNPFLWWFGILGVFYVAYKAWLKKDWRLWLVVVGYLAFWLPWARAPRVMFIYHYLPSVPFLCMALSYSLSELPVRYCRLLVGLIVAVVGITFVFFYPHWTGIFVPKWWDELYPWFPSWR